MARRIDPEGAETDALARLAPVDGLRVLELGCGDGRLTFRYADAAASVLAIDPDPDLIARARAAVPSRLAQRPARDAVRALAQTAAPAARRLGCADELQEVERICERGTGAQEQRRVLAETQSLVAVARWLAKETLSAV